MELDALLLSRIQFAFTISFHIIFPAFTIGLASWLMALEFNWLRTGNALYRNLFRFWAKIFAVSFGLGVVSGIVMSFQFGTNWSRFAEFTGNVLGPADPLRGDHRLLPGGRVPRHHAVRLGRGRQPAAFLRHLHGGARHADLRVLDPVRQFLDADARRLPDRERHRGAGRLVQDRLQPVLPAALRPHGDGLLSHHRLRGRRHVGLDDPPPARGARREGRGRARSMSMALWFAAIFAPVQIFIGDLHGLGVLKYQPTKLAAIEGNWERQANMPLRLFAIPDEEAETNHYEIAIPKIGSWILTHAYDGVVPGPEGRAARPAAAGAAGLLLLPHHGGDRLRHARARPVEPLPALDAASSTPIRGSCAPPC